MVAQNNEFMSATAESIFLANQDYNVRKVIRERQEHEMYVEKIEKENKTLKNEVTSLSDKNTTLSDEVASLRKLLEEHGIKAPK